jgi:NAD(P)H dehydrogenase (quinone)
MEKHLIIKSLHKEESFLAKGTETLHKKLTSLGREVIVRDLYDLKFNPVLSSEDFVLLKRDALPEDIIAEQKYIKESKYLWFLFPIWWTHMPAILKGYIDRVFLNGFAYKMIGDSVKGLLQDKKVFIFNSMGESREHYNEIGMFSALEKTMDLGIFKFCGMEVVQHMYFTSIMSASEERRNNYLSKINDTAEQVVLSKNILFDRI